MAERPDAELLRSPAPADFGRFYDRHLDPVLAFVAARVRPPEAVFDLVSETFARALEHRAAYDAARGPAIAWLLGIARHLIIDAVRRGQIEATSRQRLGIAPIELDDDALARIEAGGRRDLRDALAAMPAEQREAVIRRVVLEEPYATLAENLCCSEQVARKRVSRGLATLRCTLEGP